MEKAGLETLQLCHNRRTLIEGKLNHMHAARGDAILTCLLIDLSFFRFNLLIMYLIINFLCYDHLYSPLIFEPREHMCSDKAEWVVCQEYWFWDMIYNQLQYEIPFVSYCFQLDKIVCILRIINYPILMRFLAKQFSENFHKWITN